MSFASQKYLHYYNVTGYPTAGECLSGKESSLTSDERYHLVEKANTGEFFLHPDNHDSKSSPVEPLLHPIGKEAVIQYISEGQPRPDRPPTALLGNKWPGKPMIWSRTGQAFLSIRDANARLHIPAARIKKHLLDGEPLFGSEKLVLDERDPYDRYYALRIDRATGELVHVVWERRRGAGDEAAAR